MVQVLKIIPLVLPLLGVGVGVGTLGTAWGGTVGGQQSETRVENPSLAIPAVSRIGIIDIEAVLRRSLVWADFLNKVETRRANAQQDIVKRQTQLEREGKELTENRTQLAEGEFEKKRQDYFSKVQQLQTDTQTIKKELDSYFIEGRDIVYKNLNDILEAVGKDYKLTMILDKKAPSIILYADKRIVLDDLVLQKLNERIQMLDK